MPRLEEIRDLSGFMDLDSDLASVSPGNTRRRYNILSDPRNENKGAGGKPPGTREIPNQYLPAGNNRTIGEIDNLKENSFFLMLYNDRLNHCIFHVYLDSDEVIPVILNEPKLNFKIDHRITHGGVLGKLLFWTDGYDNSFIDSDFNSPRQINYERAVNYVQKPYYQEGVTSYQDGLGWSGGQYCIYKGYIYRAVSPILETENIPPSGEPTNNSHWYYVERFNVNETYLNFNLGVFERVKYPPLLMQATYLSDYSKKYNNLRSNYFQFSYRFQYVDKEYSVLSPFTNVPLPVGEDSLFGKTIEDPGLNNSIRLSYSLGGEDVISIEIFCRDNESKIWKMVESVDKYDSTGFLIYPTTNGIYDFYNDSQGFPVDQSDVSRLFDGVPQISKAMEIIEDNKIVDGSFTEGYDNVDINVELELIPKVVEFNSFVDLYFEINYNQSGGSTYITFTIPPFSPSYINQEFIIQIVEFGTTGSGFANGVAQFTLPEVDPDDYFEFVWEKFEELLLPAFSGWAIPTPLEIFRGDPADYIVQPPPWTLEITPDKFFVTASGTTQPTGDIFWRLYDPQDNKFNTFKHGSYQLLGIVYYDRALRSGTNNISEQSKIYIPNYTREIGIYRNDLTTLLRWSIKHRPPEWAVACEWVLASRPSYSNMEQYYVDFADFTEGDVYIKIAINKNLISQIDLNKNINIPQYLYAKGDRLKVIGRSQGEEDWVVVYPSLYDFPILGEEIDEDDSSEYQIYVQNFYLESLGEFDSLLVEIYTPRKGMSEESVIYYGMGEVFEIGNPHTENRYHKMGNDEDGGTWAQDQNPVNFDTIPARGVFLRGDAWVSLRWQFPLSVIVESINYSDFHDSFISLNGRPSIFDRDSKRRVHDHELIHGGAWFSGTDINELNKVLIDGSNKTSVKEKFGEITNLQESGYILRVRQKSKVTSIYLGRQGLATAKESGIDIVVASNNLLGTHYYHSQDIGTSNPESCFKDDFGSHYFVDVMSKNLVRDNNGGIVSINQGMVGEINDIMSGIINSGDSPVFFGGFDSINNQLYIFFGSEDSDNITYHSCLVYKLGNQDTSGFLSFLTMYKDIGGDLVGPDHMFSMNDKIYASLKGVLYVMDDTDNPNIFFGDKQNSSVEMVFNKIPLTDKNYMSIAIDANEAWSAPNYGDIKIPSNILYPIGMESKLAAGNFKSKENDYTAEFLKDALTNSPVPPLAKSYSLKDLFNGRDLVGRTLIVTLQNSSFYNSVLRAVKVVSFISKK